MKKFVLLLSTIILLFNGCSSRNSSTSEPVNAKVLEIKVDVGTKVNAGDPIIHLDTKDLQEQLNQAEASVATNQANLNKIKSGTRSEQIASQQATVAGAKKTYEIAQKNYDHQKQLLQSGTISQAGFEQAEQSLSNAKAQYDSAVQTLTSLQNGSTQADINAGEMSGIGQPLIAIINTNQLHIDSYAPEELLPKLRVGQEVNIKVSEFSDKILKGEIFTINAQIDSRNKNALIKIAIKDGSDILKPGMFTEIGLKN